MINPLQPRHTITVEYAKKALTNNIAISSGMYKSISYNEKQKSYWVTSPMSEMIFDDLEEAVNHYNGIL